MLNKVKFKKKYRSFEKDDEFSFSNGVNILVGDQGCGKSTLLELITNAFKKESQIINLDSSELKSIYFDFEKHNPRVAKVKARIDDFYRKMSHGQMMNIILARLDAEKNLLIIMDEPDCGLSMRSCFKLIDLMNNSASSKNCQIIASIHNPVIIENYENVLCLETKKWVSNSEFISSQIP